MQKRQFVIGCNDFSVVKPSFITFTCNFIAAMSGGGVRSELAQAYERSPCHFYCKAASMIKGWGDYRDREGSVCKGGRVRSKAKLNEGEPDQDIFARHRSRKDGIIYNSCVEGW